MVNGHRTGRWVCSIRIKPLACSPCRATRTLIDQVTPTLLTMFQKLTIRRSLSAVGSILRWLARGLAIANLADCKHSTAGEAGAHVNAGGATLCRMVTGG